VRTRRCTTRLGRSLCALHADGVKRVHRIANVQRDRAAGDAAEHFGHLRHLSPDAEWNYVNVRRYFVYLEHSIDEGTQWAVFEPNDESLVRDVVRELVDAAVKTPKGGAVVYVVRCRRRDGEASVCDVVLAALCD
jgi:hypothetical protein